MAKTNRAFWILGLGAGAAAVGVGVYFATKKPAPPASLPVSMTNPDATAAPKVATEIAANGVVKTTVTAPDGTTQTTYTATQAQPQAVRAAYNVYVPPPTLPKV
jgi:hypothetical protein